jgi:flagellar motor switch protein FliN
MVSIHAGDSFSREMAAEMLGMEVEEIEGDEEIRDMLGEMGNIVGGNLKSAFTDAGLMCALSTPSFTSGTDFKIEALNMENYERFAFRCGKNIIFVEMGVKVSELVQADPRQGKDIHYAVGDDTTPEDAPAPSSEAKEEVSATSASDPAIPEQPDVSAKPDGVQAGEQEQPQISVKPDEHKAAEQEQPQISVKPDEHKAAEQEQPQVSAKPDEHKAAEPEQSTVHPAEKGPAEIQDSKTPEDVDLDLLFDIPLEIKVELGRVRVKIRKLLNLAPGSALKLIKLEGDPVDILVNDTLIARGEVVVQNEKYGIRVTEITSRMDRIRSFGI